MSTFRVNKNVNYTVMSNYHLQDKRLSLKAKGLLSYMLSLPDDWDYSLKGLTIGCKDGLDSVRTAVLELEDHGYVRRQKVRNARGQIIDYDYQVYESPVEDIPAVPGDDNSTPADARHADASLPAGARLPLAVGEPPAHEGSPHAASTHAARQSAGSAAPDVADAVDVADGEPA